MRYYVTFGDSHRRTLDRIEIGPHGVVAVDTADAETARRAVQIVFGHRWSHLYDEVEMVWESPEGHPYFPDGVVGVLKWRAGVPVLRAEVGGAE